MLLAEYPRLLLPGGGVSQFLEVALGYLGGPEHWYLMGWCRLRRAVRCFRLDRIFDPMATDEVVRPRPIDLSALDIPHSLRSPALV